MSESLPTCGGQNLPEPVPTFLLIATHSFPAGAHQETDKCCREHDHCQHVIHPFTYKYGYRNFRWHTISHCDCDNR